MSRCFSAKSKWSALIESLHYYLTNHILESDQNITTAEEMYILHGWGYTGSSLTLENTTLENTTEIQL